MAIVSFWNDSKKETGQTYSAIAVATSMSIEHNYKVLEISTGFQDKTVEECFWNEQNENNLKDIIGLPTRQVGMNNGIEGLVKILQSNRSSSNIVSDYSKPIFRDRLEVLPAPSTGNISEYNEITKYYAELLKVADKNYNVIIVDIDKNMKEEDKRAILNVSNIVVMTFKQGMDALDEITELKQKGLPFDPNHLMLLMGKYDENSKYNIKNVTRFLKEKREISAVPYSVLYNEAATEGKVADYFLKYRSMTDTTDKNVTFIKETHKACENIVSRLKELQVRT